MPLLRCQIEPTCRSMTATVLSCEPVEGGFDALLDDTVLYPEGGGQPADHGTVDGWDARGLRREARGVVHRLDGPVSGQVEVVVDWRRRYDHMQQHSAQHLITAVALAELGLPTIAFHLGAARCDVELDAAGVGKDELARVEDAVNAAIRAALPIGAAEVEPEALEAMGVRTRGMPDWHTGPARVVEIAGLDRNTCGGTHVASTAELQGVVFLGTERLRRGTRLHWLAGGRVLAELRGALAREAAVTRALSVGADEHAAAVERLLADAKAGGKARAALVGELATHLGLALAGSGPVAALHREEGDLAILGQIAAVASAKAPEGLFLLTAGEGEGVFLLAGPEGAVRVAGPVVAAALGGRGGGARGRFQGRAAALGERAAALDAIRALASPH